MQKAENLEARFTAAQRQDLRRLGLIDAQIEQLEPILCVCKAVLDVHTNVAPLNEVRDEFDRVEIALQAAQNHLTALRDARQSQPAPQEARLRIKVELYRTNPKSDQIEEALQALQIVIDGVRSSKKRLPGEQRRHHTASSEPIEIIYNALLRAQLQGTNAPEFRFHPSSGEGSPFYCVVEICYAASRPNAATSPERAIKAFLKERKESARVRYAGYETTLQEPTSGRKVPKKRTLPSTKTTK